MTNPVLSNEAANSAVALWQYDRAPNLLALMRGFNALAAATVTRFWDYFRDGVFNVWTADSFGLSVLGRLLGLPRPVVSLSADGSDPDPSPSGVPFPVSDSLYRRLLLGRFFLFNMSPTTPNYNRYLHIVFGDHAVAVTDGLDMSMSFSAPVSAVLGAMAATDPSSGDAPLPDPDPLAEEQAMHSQHPELIYFYPAGIKTNLLGRHSTLAVGVVGQTAQQPFASAFAWSTDTSTQGGIVAGNKEARYLSATETAQGEST